MSSSSPTDPPCYDQGDTAWVMISSVLVLGMIPALAFFEAGLLPRRSTTSLITQIFAGVAIMSMLWQVIGYTLTFGQDNWYVIGNLKYVFFIGVDSGCSIYSPTLPNSAFAVFQMMFASITPLLMTGAFAERLKWKPYLIFIILWEILVYYPVAHWVWGGGWLAYLGVRDFAGGIVIHTTAGISSLIIALVLGRRKNFDKYHGEFPPSNLPLAAIGAALLWMGWFGFNAGSALGSGQLASITFLNTQSGSATSAIVWLLISWIRHRKPSAVAVINGAIAGLAGITPAAGYINVQSAFVVGIILGLASYFSVWLLKHKLRIDDALDVSSVHGVTGVVGSIATGFCANPSINSVVTKGVIYGGGRQLGVQVLGVTVAAAWAAFFTLALILTLKLIEIRVFRMGITQQQEHDTGLDALEYEEKMPYLFELPDDDDEEDGHGHHGAHGAGHGRHKNVPHSKEETISIFQASSINGPIPNLSDS